MNRTISNTAVKVTALLLALTAILSAVILPARADYSQNMSMSSSGIEFLCSLEGFRSTCYRDGTQSSIGYGTKCGSSIHASGTHSISREEAMNRVRNVLPTYETRVRQQTSGVSMSQTQYDVLVSFAYNTGGGNSAVRNCPLVKYLTGALSESEARSQYANYFVNYNGRKSQGLVNRRNKEADRFFSGAAQASVGEGLYAIRSALDPNYVLDCCGAAMYERASVILYHSNDQDNQRIFTKLQENGLVGLGFLHSGGCLDIRGGVTEGADLIQFNWYAQINQKYRIISNGDGTYRIASAGDENLVFTVSGGVAQDCVSITVQRWNGSLSQRFYFDRKDAVEQSIQCFPACSSGCTTITTGLQNIGANSSYSYRATIAAANSISGYRGTAEQNNYMLKLLKEGRLVKP